MGDEEIKEIIDTYGGKTNGEKTEQVKRNEVTKYKYL